MSDERGLAMERAGFASAKLHPAAGVKRVVLVLGSITAFAAVAATLMGAEFTFTATLMGLLAPTWLVALWARAGPRRAARG